MPIEEIRAKILRLHYDLEINKPHSFFNTDDLPRLIPSVPQNLLDASLLYLYESHLIRGEMVTGRGTPILTRITPQGTNVIERPEIARRFTLDIQVLNINTNYGQVAQATQGATITQTQTYSSFDDIRRLIRNHTELTTEESQEIDKVLSELEKRAKQGLTNDIVEHAKQALRKYGWLMSPLMQVLSKAIGLG